MSDVNIIHVNIYVVVNKTPVYYCTNRANFDLIKCDKFTKCSVLNSESTNICFAKLKEQLVLNNL